MNETLTVELHGKAQAKLALKAQLFPFLDRVLESPGRWVLTISRRKRTKPQNRRYWGNGVLAQIAAQAVVNGKLYSAEIWHEQAKRMFVGFDELPNGQIVGKSTTGLSTTEFSEFCTAVEAWAATELGVTFYELQENA